MATKLYFHNASNPLSGTFPTNETSAVAPDWVASTATTLKTMSGSIGAAQVSKAGTSPANVNPQDSFLGFFCSDTLNVDQTVGGGSITLNAAEAESNAVANFWINSLNVYVWRPSNGTKVGTVVDATGSSLGGTEPTSASSEQVTHITGITSSAVAGLAGDVIICEVWGRQSTTQTVARTCTFYYDGTTENTTENAVVSNHASYIELAETLTFGTPAGGAAFPFQRPYANFTHMLVR